MNVLAIETATENCSVALWLDQETMEIAEVIPNQHSGRLHSMIQEVLISKDVKLNHLDAIAVDIGPGSFTGVRIGIGVAQGLAFASHIPTIGIGSLSALAQPYRDSLVLSAIDARMGQVYWALFDTSNGIKPLTPPLVSNPSQVAGVISNLPIDNELSDVALLGVGSGWEAYGAQIIAPDQVADLTVAEPMYPSAGCIAALSQEEQSTNPALLSAAYVRNDVAKKAGSQIRV
ncbi:MAG: tRNA (adenosine(37)-N6)-threonylcarbamoyltransferase complex dimerization subunit type 1 TsaB [Acidiferrobacterales bacterium]|nr:tRNA (adenosine(37)-N6)-threonylcarbamoyltransferase complex dimerization subunit type 1 TsaB [Acidiferrobacterales bacterium]